MVDRLVNRSDERLTLQATWASAAAGSPQLVIVWGRRRVGKTFLLLHFLRSLPSGVRRVYHEATTQSAEVELQRFYGSVRHALGPDALAPAGGAFASWEAALKFVAYAARDEPLAVVIDEVSYLARTAPWWPSVVQAVWDPLSHGVDSAKLWLVLTGSAVGVIEQMRGGRGALFRRATAEIRMQPMDLLPAREFLPDLDAPSYVEAFAACGGYPLHLRAWDETQSTADNLARLAFSPGGLLLDDAAATLREELGGVGGYQNVLAAIGRGRTRFGQIQNDAGQRVEYPLEVLQEARLVRRSTPVGAPVRARPIYEIPDAYMRFWFSNLYGWNQHIEGGQGADVQRRRKDEWVKHVASTFEEAARAHTARLVMRGDVPSSLVGRWWAQSGPATEIDVVALNAAAEPVLLGEVAWSARAARAADLHRLTQKARRLKAAGDPPVFCFWRRRGRASELADAPGYTAEDVLH